MDSVSFTIYGERDENYRFRVDSDKRLFISIVDCGEIESEFGAMSINDVDDVIKGLEYLKKAFENGN